MDYEKVLGEHKFQTYEELKNGLLRLIDEGKISREDAARLLPELRESEDERIRKSLIELVEQFMADERKEKTLTWLEKQKEQNPAWSEENKRAIDRACVALRAYSNGDLPEFLPSELLGYADRLQSLRPQPHWKPSKEQMNALLSARFLYRDGLENSATASALESLYVELENL